MKWLKRFSQRELERAYAGLDMEASIVFQIKRERRWLDAFVKTGVFGRDTSILLDEIHQKMLEHTNDYLSVVKRFREYANCEISDIFVARFFLSETDSAERAYNITILPRDAQFDSVKMKYSKQCETFGVEEVSIPFNVFLCLPRYRGIDIGNRAGIFRLGAPTVPLIV